MSEGMDYLVGLARRTYKLAPTIAKHAVLASLDATPVSLRSKPENVAAISRVIRKTEHDQFAKLATPKGRNDFLAATRNYLRGITDHEELLVAFGTRNGSKRSAASRLNHIWRGVGTEHEVGLTPTLLHAIGNSIQQERGSVLLVHNHPKADVKTLLSMLLGWSPVPSSADRSLALKFNLQTLINLLKGQGSTAVRWYLVDEGEIGEFYLPPVELFEALWQKLVATAPASGRSS